MDGSAFSSVRGGMTKDTNKKDRDACDTQPLENNTTDNANSATPSEEGKALTTIKARFALAGHTVHELGNKDYLVTRWGHSKHCPDYASLIGFARVLGVFNL